jgi:integrase/recombinase XerD
MTPLTHALATYVEACRVRGQSERTLEQRNSALRAFIGWCDERGLTAPGAVTVQAIERYRRHLFHHRRADGQGLSLATQRNRLTQVKGWFRWLARERWIAFNPASELDLPRLHRRLPRAILTADEVAAVLRHTAVFGALGVRDRALLETFYATGIRRQELARLSVYDVDPVNGTVMVREGKGRKDRLLPIGDRACGWIARYRDDVRPGLVVDPGERALFLTEVGRPFTPGQLSDRVKKYFIACGIAKPGACHLFRHTMATQMLDNGADLRFIQAMLGHADISTTTIYTHVSLATLRAVYERTHPAQAADTEAAR